MEWLIRAARPRHIARRRARRPNSTLLPSCARRERRGAAAGSPPSSERGLDAQAAQTAATGLAHAPHRGVRHGGAAARRPDGVLLPRRAAVALLLSDAEGAERRWRPGRGVDRGARAPRPVRGPGLRGRRAGDGRGPEAAGRGYPRMVREVAVEGWSRGLWPGECVRERGDCPSGRHGGDPARLPQRGPAERPSWRRSAAEERWRSFSCNDPPAGVQRRRRGPSGRRPGRKTPEMG